MTDRLSLANALAEAKIDRAAAERIATEIYDAVQYNVATKSDVESSRRELKADIELLRTELRADMASLEHRVIMRLGSLVVAVAGLLFVALRYLPPVH